MRGILPDTSVWVDFFNPRASNPQKTQMRILFDSKYQLFICPTVYQEVLQGIGLSETKRFTQTRKQLLKCRRGSTGTMQAANKAIEIYRNLRQLGVTIRKSNDCLIAAYCILNNLALLHHDRDFDPIEQHCGLVVAR
jgi:predicted nucleic acid-binding protein